MPDKNLKKEVTMVAYSSGRAGRPRQFAGELSGLDMETKETEEQEKWEVVIDVGGFAGEETYTFYPDRVNDDRLSEMQENLDLEDDHVEVNHEVNQRSYYVNSKTDAKNAILEQVMEEHCPEVIDGGFERNVHFNRWEGDHVYPVNIRGGDFDKQRILAKESDRENDDLYQTTAEYPSFQFRVIMEAEDQEQMDTWTEEVITNLHKGLSQNSAVGEVRYMSCTVTEQREGECYNL